MIGVDCAELTGDEMLAMASAISERLDGAGVAIVKDDKIMIDQLSKSKITVAEVLSLIEAFVSRRQDPAHYSVEVSGDNVTVHSRGPLKGGKKKAVHRLPPGFLQCSLCGFLTKDQERLSLHIRTAHDLIR